MSCQISVALYGTRMAPFRSASVPANSCQHLQVHGAVLSKGLVAELGWRWRHGREVVLKVQHPDMKALMDSDVRNLGRLADFVRGTLPFDVFPVSSPSLWSPNNLFYVFPASFPFLRSPLNKLDSHMSLQSSTWITSCRPLAFCIAWVQIAVEPRMFLVQEDDLGLLSGLGWV